MTKVRSHLDFGKDAQLINITLHKVSSLPNPGWPGGFVYLIPTGKVYYHNGSDWIAVDDTTGLISEVTGGGGITISGTGASRKVAFAPDNESLDLEAGDSGKARVKEKGIKSSHIDDEQVNTTHLANNAVTTVKIADKQITFAKIQDVPTMTVIGRLVPGSGVAEGVQVITTIDSSVTANDSLASAKAVKDYVDNAVGGLGQLQGDWSATSGNFPSTSKKGDYWFINDTGTIQGIEFITADVIIAKIDSAGQDKDNWIALKTKRGQASTTNLGFIKIATQAEARAMSDTEKALTPKHLDDVRATNAEAQGSSSDRFVTPQGLHNRTATTTRRGIAELATQAEVDAGTDNVRIVTPLTLRTFINDMMAGFGKYTQLVGNGSATTITVNHQLGTKDLHIDIYDNSTGETVFVSSTRTTNDDVVLNFASAPASNAYRIVLTRQ